MNRGNPEMKKRMTRGINEEGVAETGDAAGDRQAAQRPQVQTAVVGEVSNGEARSVYGLDGGAEAVPVHGHASDLPWLATGDRVLVVTTPDGVVVTTRLRRPGERPQMTLPVDEERVDLVVDRAIRLQAGRCRLELHPDGTIRLDGREIATTAEGNLRLSGARIEVN